MLKPQGISGDLHHETDHYEYVHSGATPDVAISLTMPVRRSPYRSPQLFFRSFSKSAGRFRAGQLRLRLAKLIQLDPMLLLAISGHDGAIGRLAVGSVDVDRLLGSMQPATKAERLSEILAWGGTESPFAELVDRYLLRTGISGVQPKVLVPELTEASGSKPRWSRATSS